MINHKHTTFSLILAAILAISCGREKTHLPARFYHNTHSYFNGYYNANEILQEAIREIETEYLFGDEGFIEIQPYGNESQVNSVRPKMEEAIRKNDVVMYKHPNGNWLDDCRFLNGKCWFYKQDYTLAMQNFDDVLNNFPEFDHTQEVYLWKAKTYYMLDNTEMARDFLNEFIVDDPGLNPKGTFRGDIAIFRVQLAMDDQDYEQAIEILEQNMRQIRGFGRRARAHFLLGQLYEKKGDFPRSLTQFKSVKRFTNDYDLIFDSKIKIARLYIVYQGGKDDDKKIYKYLKRLLKDEKNEEFQDQIYYEMALLEHKKDSFPAALDNLHLSTRVSRQNPRQKALSYFKAGDIYFYELQDYPNASAYYDSAAQVIPETAQEYKNYQDISKTFKDYITCVRTIAYQDSMLTLAELPQAALDSIVDLVYAGDQERQRKLQEQQAADAANNPSRNNDLLALNQLNQMNNRRNPGLDPSGNSGGWYFDNPSSISSGRLEFERKWGKRPNEDNWRRKNKSSTFQDNTATAAADTSAEAGGIDSALVEQYGDKFMYYRDIPKTEEEKEAAHEKIQSSLYRLGQIYYETLSEVDSAVNTYEQLLNRYEGTEYALRARYALYQLYSDLDNPLAEAQKAYILNEYPTSVYAYLLLGYDPKDIAREEEEFIYAYEGLFKAYYSGQFISSLGFAEFLLAQYSERPGLELDQLHYIRGMSYGYLGLKDSLETILTRFIQDFPKSEMAPIAKETLKYLEEEKQNQPVTEAEGQAPPQAPAEPSPEGETDERFKGFSTEINPNGKLFVLMLVPREGKDKNVLRELIKKFNDEKPEFAGLKSFVFDYQRTHFLPYISSFNNKEEAMAYIEAFNGAPLKGEVLSHPESRIFFVTQDNFREAYGKKRMEDYVAFFEEKLHP